MKSYSNKFINYKNNYKYIINIKRLNNHKMNRLPVSILTTPKFKDNKNMK